MIRLPGRIDKFGNREMFGGLLVASDAMLYHLYRQMMVRLFRPRQCRKQNKRREKGQKSMLGELWWGKTYHSVCIDERK